MASCNVAGGCGGGDGAGVTVLCGHAVAADGKQHSVAGGQAAGQSCQISGWHSAYSFPVSYQLWSFNGRCWSTGISCGACSMCPSPMPVLHAHYVIWSAWLGLSMTSSWFISKAVILCACAQAPICRCIHHFGSLSACTRGQGVYSQPALDVPPHDSATP